ncbi:MAG: response regulator [Deltaproteobacteria bacterium]|nr:MAG: response regulator [Deltaproteobacteria bacterium]
MEKKKILIVDDDKVILDIVKDALTQEGYSVFTSDQPLGTSNKVAQIKPHLVVLDVGMPGLSGDKICRNLKESNIFKEIKVILFSIKTREELEKLAAESQADDFLTKSDNLQKLVKKVKHHLKVP